MSSEEPQRRVVVVMGVSASGKSSVAAALAARLGCPWLDADDLHPAANIAKMAAGAPLDDDDRRPWLDAVGRRMAEDCAAGDLVVACSALKRAYRDHLRAACPAAVFLHLHGDRAILAARAGARPGHFMPAELLQSQLATLEPLGSDEPGAEIGIDAELDTVVDGAERWLRDHS